MGEIRIEEIIYNDVWKRLCGSGLFAQRVAVNRLDHTILALHLPPAFLVALFHTSLRFAVLGIWSLVSAQIHRWSEFVPSEVTV